jgi:hypothetical protein
MNNLLLQPSRANEYEVIDGDWIVGHIVLLSSRTLWMWSWITPSIEAAIRRTASRPREMQLSREAGSVRTNREIAPLWPLKDAGGPGFQAAGAFPVANARVGDLGPTNAIRSPELGRSPFWERSSRALPDPEDLPGESSE